MLHVDADRRRSFSCDVRDVTTSITSLSSSSPLLSCLQQQQPAILSYWPTVNCPSLMHVTPVEFLMQSHLIYKNILFICGGSNPPPSN